VTWVSWLKANKACSSNPSVIRDVLPIFIRAIVS
jgi:hypothetical protein